jgi:hypothetical protein
MDQTAHYKAARKKALPILFGLLETTDPAEDNSFLVDRTSFIKTKWLFKQPELRPFLKFRHSLTQILKNYSGVEVVENEHGFVCGVALNYDEDDYEQEVLEH